MTPTFNLSLSSPLFKKLVSVYDSFKTINNRNIAIVLLLSGLLGFWAGMVAYPRWQDCVESAQVLAGLVHYPVTNPYYIYHTKLWTLLNQIPAFFLYLGASERTLSLVLSGLGGMLSFQALALCVLAFSADATLALLSICFIRYSVNNLGVVYSIILMGSVYTYGMIGFSYVVLVMALFALARYRIGGFLAGLAPAIHFSLGAWLLLILTLCFLWDFRNLRAVLKPMVKYFLIGAAISALSFIYQFLFVSPKISIDSSIASQYLKAFIEFWDIHRIAVPLGHPGVILNIVVIGIGLIGARLFKEKLVASTLFLLHALTVAAILGMVSIFVSRLPVAIVPNALLVLMPARILNFAGFGFMALVIGLLWQDRQNYWTQALLMMVILTAVLAKYVDGYLLVVYIAAMAIVAYMLSLSDSRITLIFFRLAVILYFVLVSARFIMTIPIYGKSQGQLSDWTNDPFWHKVSLRKGMLLTASDLHSIQVRTRRPVLLDGGGLDMLPYIPESGPEMNRMLRGVYGLDILNPLSQGRHLSVVQRDMDKALWEGRSLGEWRAVGKEFGITDIITYSNYRLQLPQLISNNNLTLYHIPQETEAVEAR